MKLLNKNKIIVSALALAIGTSLVGSISGTVAWYQYSTRANVSFIGQSGGFSSNLQMRFKGENDNAWRTRITWQEMNANLGTNGYASKIVPMTFGGLDKDAALPANGYVQPLAGVGAMAKWNKAGKANYAQFTLQLRNINRNGNAAANDVQDVYISKLLIQEDAKNADGKEDLTDAVRIHISSNYGGGTNKLISDKGLDTVTSGKLDLDGDGKIDKAYPDDDEFGVGYTGDERNVLSYVKYGDSGVQKSYANASDIVDGTKWQQDDLDAVVAAAYDKTVEDWKVEPVAAVDYTQDEANEYNAAHNLSENDEGYKTTADVKTPAVEGVHFTQAEIDLADEAHGKSAGDWRVEPSNPIKVFSDDNKLYNSSEKDDEEDFAANKLIGKTVAGSESYLEVTVTIWVEGWQKFNGNAIWDAVKYVNSQFNVGIQFAVQDQLA